MADIDATDDAGNGGNKRRDRRPPLDTCERVRIEMGKLYREARAGTVDVSDASKLANMLNILARLIETSDLEKRLEVLEANNGK